MTTQLQFIIIRRPAWRGRGFRVSYLRIALLSVICWCALYLRSSLHVFLTTTVALHSKHIHTYRCSFFFNTSVKMAVRGRNMLEVYHRFVSYYNPEFWCVCVCVCVCGDCNVHSSMVIQWTTGNTETALKTEMIFCTKRQFALQSQLLL